jgi:hypothetical protein
MIRIVIIFIIAVLAVAYVTRPTQTDIDACMATTTMNEAECRHTLSL